MTSYTTFFLCTPDELATGFPNWKPPLKKPVLRRVKNPAGGFFTIPSIAPEWPEYAEVPLEQLGERRSSEEEFSESRLPAVVRDHPHFATELIGTSPLTVLSDVIGASSTFELALCAPPIVSQQLVEFPEPMFSKLKTLDVNELPAIAGRWAEKLLPPDDWEPEEGEPVEEPWSVEFALSILEPMVGLAKQAEDGERMYMFVKA